MAGSVAGRLDARAKTIGAAQYVGDLVVPGLAQAAMVRSPHPHARIVTIDTSAARAAAGVVGVFVAADVSDGLYGRSLADSPLLARDRTRFVGERVAAVVAETRRQAELAAELVEVSYEPLPAVFTPSEALQSGAPVVHEAAASYAGADISPGDPPNVIYHGGHGSRAACDEALAGAAYAVDRTYRAHSVHQGYLEPQACVADYRSPDSVCVWLTTKAPYRVRATISECLGLPIEAIDLRPLPLGGDFGGKGSAQDAVICVELSRLTGRPVRSVLRYGEDLTSTNPRHSAEVRVRLGADTDGRLVAASVEAVLNGGAYGGFTPRARGPHGIVEVPSYRIPVLYTESTRVYTHTVPRGNMRAPGAPQGVFAFESALDELACEAGIDPVELRRRNLLRTGEPDQAGNTWVERRGREVLDAALAAYEPVSPPPGWLHGRGIAAYSRGTASRVDTTLRLTATYGGGIRVESPLVETGTGSHSVLRRLVADRLDLDLELVEVVAVPTSALRFDQGAGGSRVTAGFAAAVDVAAQAWEGRVGNDPVTVDVAGSTGPLVGSDLVQIAQVAIDPETGQLRVLEVLTALDVARIVNPAAHQMQIDGGVAMGFGYACFEDLDEHEGRMWAASLAEFKLPTARDLPSLRTVAVTGGVGVGTANVKSIGESTTPPVAAAIANAVYAATGCRVRELPLTAERVYHALRSRR
jgi:putative selenate reductase molybdopterin-binding subunit